MSPLLKALEKCSISTWLRKIFKYAINRPIRADKPKIQAKITGWKRLIFCLNETIKSAAIVAANVAIMQGINMSVGLEAGGLTAARMAIMLMGLRVQPEACKTKNMI